MNRYELARQVALARDGFRCLICRGAGPLTTHHIIPRHISRDDRAINLVTVCRGCHDLIEELDRLPFDLSWQPYLTRKERPS